MPLQATSGAASYDAFGGGVAVAPKYIEDFFQTWLRTGTGASATVTTGLNASINKSLVWTKSRSAATNHKLTDTVRGATKALSSNTTSAEATDSQGLTAFSSTGYTIGTNTDYNNSGATYVDWQWLATPKFFDVVTYTGNRGAGSSPQTINHNLGSVPGCIIIKKLTDNSNWPTYHRSLPTPNNNAVLLNLTNAALGSGFWANTAPTSTTFTVGPDGDVNETDKTYVAYLFAHDAGGFGLTGTDNVISCGSFTTSGTGDPNAIINLGYEPQWVMLKKTNSTGNWIMYDTMRGLPVQGATSYALYANLTNAEGGNNAVKVTSVGFNADTGSDAETYIYIAIRRGPMKVPTDGTKVFSPVTRTGTGSATTVSAGFPPDWALCQGTASTIGNQVQDRLRGPTLGLRTQDTAAETSSATDALTAFGQNGINVGANTTSSYWNYSGIAYINYFLRRAPGFFDEVCYTGTGSNATVKHNLTVRPEIIITKRRDAARNWAYYTNLGATTYTAAVLNDTYAPGATPAAYDTALTAQPSSTEFYVGTSFDCNASGGTYVAYLFASCPGVSKVGSYTGNGTTLQVNCGFTAGARFVLIKRTDSTGDWYVWDSARGIVAGNDPYLLLNSTAAEVTSTDYVDTYSAGFEISSTAPAAINASGGSFIFLAIA